MDKDKWYKQMERMGQADIPIEINGEWITPREYIKRKG